MITQTKQISPGMVISFEEKLYRVESCVKVTVGRGNPFTKAKLWDLATDSLIEKNFKVNQKVEQVSLVEKDLEFLYFENKKYVFLDIDTFEQVSAPSSIVDDKALYLKEGVGVKATFYGDTVFSVELPQFLELMVVTMKDEDEEVLVSDVNKAAILESGAKIEVPQFVRVGDIVKVDTSTGEYTQRV